MVSTRKMTMAAASAGPRLVDAATQTKLEGKDSPVRASWAAIKAVREGSTEFICGRHTQLQELVHSETQLPKQERLQGAVFVDRSPEANTEASKYHQVNPDDPKTHMKRIQKQVHRPQVASKSGDQLTAPPVNSFPQKSETVNTVGSGNVSSRQCGLSNAPCAAVKQQTESLLPSHTINENTACVKNQPVLQVSEQVQGVKQKCTSDTYSLHSEIAKEEGSTSSTSASHKMAGLRCLGCTAGGQSFNSKTFTKMLQSCPYQCDHHKVLLEAEERYRKKLRTLTACSSGGNALYGSIFTPVKKLTLDTSTRADHSTNTSWTADYNLIPTCKKSRNNISGTSERDEEDVSVHWTADYNLVPIYKK